MDLIKLLEDSDSLNRIEWEASREGTKYFIIPAKINCTSWVLNLESTKSKNHVYIFYLWRHLKELKLPLASNFFQKLLNNSKIKDIAKTKNFA